MSGVEIVQSIVQIIVSAIVPIGEAIGSGLSKLAQSLFLQTVGETTSLSVFGTLVVVFAAISLGFSLVRWVLNFITSFGNRNR